MASRRASLSTLFSERWEIRRASGWLSSKGFSQRTGENVDHSAHHSHNINRENGDHSAHHSLLNMEEQGPLCASFSPKPLGEQGPLCATCLPNLRENRDLSAQHASHTSGCTHRVYTRRVYTGVHRVYNRRGVYRAICLPTMLYRAICPPTIPTLLYPPYTPWVHPVYTPLSAGVPCTALGVLGVPR